MQPLTIAGRPAALAALALLAGAAHGQATLTYAEHRAKVVMEVNSTNNNGLQTDFSGNDVLLYEDRWLSHNGFEGNAWAKDGAAYSPSSPGIFGTFHQVDLTACTSAAVYASNIGPNTWENADALARSTIHFTVSTPMIWEWDLGWGGVSDANGSFSQVWAEQSLFDVSGGTYLVNEFRHSILGVGDWSETIPFSGVLNPGSYILHWESFSEQVGGNTSFGYFPWSHGTCNACIESQFRVRPIPAPGVVAPFAWVALIASRRRRA